MDIDAEWNALLYIVENGSRFEALRAARQLKELAPKRRIEREQAKEKQQEKLAP
jgi:hypothetical protein